MTPKQTEEVAKRARSIGSAADTTTEKTGEDRSFEAGPTRAVEPTPEGQKFDHLAKREEEAEDRQEALLDEALEETFPGSDPISPKHIT